MRLVRSRVLTLLVLLALVGASQATARTLYYDNFDGTPGTVLTGTTPDVTTDGAAWEAGDTIGADGTLGSQFTAILPFTPENGTVYELSATFDNRGDWAAIGFLSEPGNVNTRINDNNPLLWSLTRPSGATNFDQAFLGPGTGGGLGDSTTSSAADLKIRIETISDAEWVVTWFYDGEQVFQENVAPSDYDINYVAFGGNGLFTPLTGTISNFRLMDGRESANMANSPNPADAAVDVPADTILSWFPGELAASHDVYFGTVAEDVNDASRSDDRGVLVSQGQDANSYVPLEPLTLGQTYYWRVDEVNAPASPGMYKGLLWSFTAEPYSYLVPDVNVTASVPGTSDPNNLVNDPNAKGTSTEDGTLWSVDPGDANGVSLDFDLGQLYRLDEMLVWNFNLALEASGFLNFSVKDIAVESSIDGETWTPLGDYTLTQGTGTVDNPGQVIKLDNTVAQYVRLIAKNTYGGAVFGLSEVHFFYVPTRAREPQPEIGAENVAPEVMLSWRAGREAVAHEVSLGTDEQAVIDGLAVVGSTNMTTYSAGPLALGATYYWKIVEVNDAEQPSTWASDVWNFTTVPYLVVDDMENYSGEEGSEIFKTWLDGIELGDSGSVVGYNDPPYVETSITHSGAKSMPISYGQNSNFNFSTAQRTFAIAQDWTAGDVTTLTVFFYGAAANDPAEPMWIELTDQSGKTGKVTYGTGPAESADNQAVASWHEWSIPLSQFGINLTLVKSMTIGFGGVAATETMGTVIFDDIRLYPPSSASEAVLAGYWALDNNALDGSGNGNDGTLNGGATWTAAGKVVGALSLNGVDAYVDCGNGPSLDITDAISLSAWVNMADAGNGQHNPFVGKGDQAFAIKHNANNELETFIYDGGWFTVTYPIDETWNDEWHHVASTYDGLNIRLYVDGVLRTTREHAGAISSTMYNVNLGRNAQNTGRLYEGLLDEARIYHGALSSAEIVELATQ